MPTHIYHAVLLTRLCRAQHLFFVAVFVDEVSDLVIHPQWVLFSIGLVELYDNGKVYIGRKRHTGHSSPVSILDGSHT